MSTPAPQEACTSVPAIADGTPRNTVPSSSAEVMQRCYDAACDWVATQIPVVLRGDASPELIVAVGGGVLMRMKLERK
jgi:hypothetical protein